MAEFSTTDVALAGFRLVRAHPRAVAIWALAYLAMGLVMGAAAAALVGPTMAEMQASAGDPSEDPAVAFGRLAAMAPFLIVATAAGLVFYSMIYAAIARAVLQPENPGAANLRLGGDEGRQMLLMLLQSLVLFGAYIGSAMVAVLLVVGAALVAQPLAAVTGVVAMVGVLVGLAFLVVRLSLAPPLTFHTRRVNLFGSWRLTQGRFWSLSGAYLLAAIFTVLVALLGFVITGVSAPSRVGSRPCSAIRRRWPNS